MPSTVIHSFQYDADARLLLIVFHSGRRYLYSEVPFDVYQALRRSRSKGAYFNQHIRDRFAHVEVMTPE